MYDRTVDYLGSAKSRYLAIQIAKAAYNGFGFGFALKSFFLGFGYPGYRVYLTWPPFSIPHDISRNACNTVEMDTRSYPLNGTASFIAGILQVLSPLGMGHSEMTLAADPPECGNAAQSILACLLARLNKEMYLPRDCSIPPRRAP